MSANKGDESSAVASVLSIIRSIVELRGQNLPRPVLVRFAWFCIGAVFVLASVRFRPSEPDAESDDTGDGQPGDRRSTGV